MAKVTLIEIINRIMVSSEGSSAAARKVIYAFFLTYTFPYFTFTHDTYFYFSM